MSNSPFLLILLAFLLISVVPSQSETPALSLCGSQNATAKMVTNIQQLLPMLVNSTKYYGSNLGYSGENDTKIYGMAQCIGGVPNDTCWSCMKNATEAIGRSCPTQSDASIWYDYCLLRYGNSNFYGDGGGGEIVFYNIVNVTHSKDFNNALEALMNETTTEALNSPKGFGKGVQKVKRHDDVIYGLLQCNKDLFDLTYMKCYQCLYRARSYLNKDRYCRNHPGCRVFDQGCFLRYEIYPFFYNSTSEGNYDNVVDVIKD